MEVMRYATLALVTLLPVTAYAQGAPPAALVESAGRSVTVTATNGAVHKGTLLSSSKAEVVLEQRTGQLRLRFDEVQRVQRNTSAVKKGLLIGLAAGAGVAAIVCARSLCQDRGWAPGMILITGIGAAGGLGAGVLMRPSAAERLVYEAPPKPPTSHARMDGRGRASAAIAIVWSF